MRNAYTTSALALVAAAASGLAMDANAILLIQGDSHYLGFVKDGEPADLPTDVLRINSLLDLPNGALPAACTQVSETCDRVGSTLNIAGLPDATVTGAIKSVGEDPSNTGINITGWKYLLGKYDGPNFGDLIWYVGDLTGTVDIQFIFKMFIRHGSF